MHANSGLCGESVGVCQTVPIRPIRSSANPLKEFIAEAGKTVELTVTVK